MQSSYKPHHVFQAVSWQSKDAKPLDDDAQDEARFTIYCFGRDMNGASVAVEVHGFQPSFFVRASDEAKCMKFMKEKDGFVRHSKVERKDFLGFRNGQKQKFVQFMFCRLKGFRMAAAMIAKECPGVVLYEANIEPLLRFMHTACLEPCSWIKVPMTSSFNGGDFFRCDLCFSCNWTHVQKATEVDASLSAKFVIASFDIECSSSTGDFPLAKKTSWKVAYDMHELYKKNTVTYDCPHALRDAILGEGELGIAKICLKPYVDKHKMLDKLLSMWSDFQLILQGNYIGVHNQMKMNKKEMEGREHENISKGSTGWIVGLYTKVRCKTLEVMGKIMSNKDLLNRNKDKYFGVIDPRGGMNVYIYQGSAGGAFKLYSSDGKEYYYTDEPSALLAFKLDSIDILGRHIEGDKVIQIGTTVHRFGEKETYHKSIITLGSCDPVPGANVQSFLSEEEVLLAWRDELNRIDPDIVTGYNIFGFDFLFMMERAQELGIATEFMKLGRFVDVQCEWCDRILHSSALGDNVMKYIDMDGRVLCDLMKVVMRDHKLDSYKLDSVASHFVQMQKDDITPNDIFRLNRGSAADRAVIAKYCLKDCELCNKLVMKLEVIANNMGMANVCTVPLSYIFLRGQGIKIFSLVAKQCLEDGFLIPKMGKKEKDGDSDNFEGALVLHPTKGIYNKLPVNVFDYASLYPSSMISENLSHDTIVLDEAFGSLDGVDYVTMTYEDVDADGNHMGVFHECKYAQTDEKGVLPRILMKLLGQRKLTRKRMQYMKAVLPNGEELVGMYDAHANVLKVEECGGTLYRKIELEEVFTLCPAFNEFQQAVLDGLQLAYKVTANSMYGQVGTYHSPIYCKHIAACTTLTGRNMIMKAKEFMAKEYGATVVYGDSVASYTPIVVKVNGKSGVYTVESFAEIWGGEWMACDNDHTKEACEICAKDCSIWSEKGWTPMERIIRHRLSETKRMLRVHTRRGIVDVTDDHSLLAEDGSPLKPLKAVIGETRLMHVSSLPGDVLQPPEYMKRNVWRGMTTCNQLLAMRACLYAVSAGVKYVVNYDHDTSSIHIHPTEAEVWDAAVVKGIIELPQASYTGAYVYDVTTATSHFAAGCGDIVVHNTDSIFAILPPPKDEVLGSDELINRSICCAKEIAEKYNATVRYPHNLEYEKTFYPFVIFSKKRYVGNMYVDDSSKFKQKYMGIALKRRDYAPIAKKVYGGVLDVILSGKDVDEAIEYLKRCLTDLVTDKFPMEDLVISKTLKSCYVNPDQIAHKVLSDRIAQRSPGSKPQVNDRIPYVYIHVPNGKKLKQGEKIETPEYIKEKKLKPDYEHYIMNQMATPLLQIFALCYDKVLKPNDVAMVEKLPPEQGKTRDALIEKLILAELLTPFVEKIRDIRGGVRKMTDFYAVTKTLKLDI